MGPLPPGFYTYGYAIDGGLRMPDPTNPNLELRRWGATSLFVIPGLEAAPIDDRKVPHGTIHVNFYDSPNLNQQRMVYVYTPPGYETGKQKLPVLYLLHGNGQIEASWTWTGRTNVILDNLLAVAIPTKPNSNPKARRTGFRREAEQQSERSDAGVLIVG